ncbi:MAG: hypothetical protein AAGG55_00520 [Pseudomonadota bacterium]
MANPILRTALLLLSLNFLIGAMHAAAQGTNSSEWLTLDDVMGQVHKKEMNRRGTTQNSFPTDADGVIDVNKIPDSYTPAQPSTSGGSATDCVWVDANSGNSGALYGTGGVGGGSRVCVCGLYEAHPSQCN